MFSCGEVCTACDTGTSQKIYPQQVPQQGAAVAQYQQAPLQAPPPPFANQVPNQALQTAYAEEKAISAGLQTIEPTLDTIQDLAPPPPLIPSTLELKVEPAQDSYQLPIEEPREVAPPPQQLAVVQPPSNSQGPDLKEPEPEETISYNPAHEFKKAAIGCSCTLAATALCFAILIMNRTSYDAPTCPEEEWYKMNNVDAPKACEPCGGGGQVVPIGGEWELAWSKPIRAVLYLVALGWCFLGIAIVCDQFMAAIEEVTSLQKVVWVRVHGDTKHKFHKKVWNDTVANLTLMALGSSAPEILLSVIELMGNQFFAGELGPSTIVGSAAFNLLVITAVCVSAIPAPEVRKIDGLAVFAVTASLSVFAYVWLIVILQMQTPDVVTKVEAVVTFAFFPMLVIIAFCADKGYLGGCSSAPTKDTTIYDEQQRLEKLYGKTISFETVKMMVEENQGPKAPQMTKAQYRRQLMKKMVGGGGNAGVSEVTVGFTNPKFITLECAGIFDVAVKLSARVEGKLEVRYFTQDGLALAGKRYTYSEGSLIFQPGETEKTIPIPIIDNEVWEEQEDFSVQLEGLTLDGVQPNDKLGYGFRSTKIVILNDDEPGTLAFFVDEVKASSEAESIQVGIERKNGSTGRISCKYSTQDATAVAGSNYSSASGELIFEEGICKASVQIGILPIGRSKIDRSFNIILSDASAGVKFDVERDGGADKAMCEVILPGTSKRGRLASCLKIFMCDLKFSSSIPDWKSQFSTACYCNGNAADQAGAGNMDWFFHCLSLPWKVTFAFIPPAAICGGWACFCSALAMIGGVTMIVGDLAALMGCCMGIPDDITAITIVALGTSLPDTFASKSAAMHDPCADNSIGNVTGSNCVNVFLGLGLPWTIAAFYWDGPKKEEWKKRDFKGLNYEKNWGDAFCKKGCFLVPAGSLSFSVIVFSCCAIACIGLLVVRRQLYGGELGGPASASKRDAVIMCGLWFLYVVMSILKSLEVI